MKLYYHPVSTTSRPVLLFIQENNIPAELQVVDLMTGEQRRLVLALVAAAKAGARALSYCCWRGSCPEAVLPGATLAPASPCGNTCALVAAEKSKIPLLVEQGGADDFMAERLQPEKLQQACAQHQHPLNLRMRDGYDHSYFFVASFVGEHVGYHAERMKKL